MGLVTLHRQFNSYNRIIMLTAGGRSTIPSTVVVKVIVFKDNLTVREIMNLKYKRGFFIVSILILGMAISAYADINKDTVQIKRR